MSDVVVIGAGLAGLTAAWQAARQGQRVKLVSKGWGATHWHAGCIDVLGYYPVTDPAPVTDLAAARHHLTETEPSHPYARLGPERLGQALAALQALCQEAGYPLAGSATSNWLLPSAVGTARPTCLAPATMIAGDLTRADSMLLVGIDRLADFQPRLVADNLARQFDLPTTSVSLSLPDLAGVRSVTPLLLARRLEDRAFRIQLVDALAPHVRGAQRVGFPAILGLERAMAVKDDLEKLLGRPVFEIPGLPPSIPGIRLQRILTLAIRRHGGQIYEGLAAIGAERNGGAVTAVFTEAAARQVRHRGERFVLATGGILGGGITTDFDGSARETVFDLPVQAPADRREWFRQDFLAAEGHPIYRAGLRVNERFQPTNERGQPLLANLYAAGTTLAGCEVVRERSLEGVALGSGFAVGQIVAEG